MDSILMGQFQTEQLMIMRTEIATGALYKQKLITLGREGIKKV